MGLGEPFSGFHFTPFPFYPFLGPLFKGFWGRNPFFPPRGDPPLGDMRDISPLELGNFAQFPPVFVCRLFGGWGPHI